jgi:hypothetical protein
VLADAAGKFLLAGASRKMQRGDLAGAAKSLSAIIEADPRGAPERAYRLLATAYLNQGEFERYDGLIADYASRHPVNEDISALSAAIREAKALPWEARSTLRLAEYTPQTHDRGAGHKLPKIYQSVSLAGVTLPGLRQPALRAAHLPIDFAGKTVLDLGCNLGGFLFPLADRVKWGIGLDNNARVINACQKIRAYHGFGNLNFFVFDLEREPLSLLPEFMPEERVDVVLMQRILSDKLGRAIRYLSGIADALVFEPIASHPASAGDIETLRRCFAEVREIDTGIPEPIDGGTHRFHVATDPLR